MATSRIKIQQGKTTRVLSYGRGAWEVGLVLRVRCVWWVKAQRDATSPPKIWFPSQSSQVTWPFSADLKKDTFFPGCGGRRETDI